ncbi:MAG: tetratricopeptide repeat protein [Planctomycetota bacterium]
MALVLAGLICACGDEAPRLFTPYDPKSAGEQMPAVIEALAAGQAEGALQLLDELERTGQLPAGAGHYRALALSDLGRLELAELAWLEELRAHPGNGFGHALYARQLLEAGRLEKAAEHLSKARQYAPSFPLSLLLAGRLALLQDEDEVAQRAFRDYLQLDPFGPLAAEAHHGLSQVAAGRGAEGAAEAQRQQELGRELSALHGFLESYRARLRNDPQDWEAAYGVGTAYLNLYTRRGADPALLAQAESALLHVVSQRPEHAKALDNLGFVRAEQRRLPEALEFFRRAVSADPDYHPARINYGRMLSQQGDRERGVLELERALEHATDPGDLARAHLLLVRIYDEWGDPLIALRAIPHLRALLAARPDDPTGLRPTLARLEREQQAAEAAGLLAPP